MSQIGQFTRGKSNFTGRIRTVSLDIELVIVPVEPSDAGNAQTTASTSKTMTARKLALDGNVSASERANTSPW